MGRLVVVRFVQGHPVEHGQVDHVVTTIWALGERTASIGCAKCWIHLYHNKMLLYCFAAYAETRRLVEHNFCTATAKDARFIPPLLVVWAL